MAIVGQEAQLKALEPVLREYNIKKEANFSSYYEKRSLILIVGEKKGSPGNSETTEE